jgi:hypothetical protein
VHILSEQFDVVCLGREGEVGEGVRETGDSRRGPGEHTGLVRRKGTTIGRVILYNT